MIRSAKNPWEWSKIGQGYPRTWWLRLIRPIGEYFTPGLGHHRNPIFVVASLWRQRGGFVKSFICKIRGHKSYINSGQWWCRRCNWFWYNPL